MLISVIVPIYNVERYLRQCLDSLINQTYNELEVIMVDDGSKDSSGKICDEYSEKYDNFKVVHKENAGLGMARNTGFEHIKGEYVTFVDSDDYLEPDCIATLYNELRNKDVDMCKGGFKRVIDSGKIVSNRIYDNELFQGEKAKKEMLPRMIGSSPTKHDSIEMCVCGALYNTKPIFEHNLRFPSERELISEDLVFNIDYMQYANGACTIDKAGYNYRVNLGSLSTSYRKDRFEASKHFYLEMHKKLMDLGYGDDTVLRLQRMFFIYIKMCIKQENGHLKDMSFKTNLSNIGKICRDETVGDVIRNYPTNLLEFRQRIFVTLIDKKATMCMVFLNFLGLI